VTTEEFRNLSAVAKLAIPHDWAGLTLRSPAGGDAHVFLTVGDGDPNAVKELSLPTESEDGDVGRLMTGEEAHACGFEAGVQVPIRVANESEGVLTLLVHRPQAYGRETLQHAQTLATYISTVLSHDDAVRRMSEQLLRLLADVLDIRDVFPRVSEIVAAAIPHDRLVLWLFEDQVTHVASNDDGPLIESVPVSRLDPKIIEQGFRLIGDLTRESLERPDFQTQLLAAGYRSLLAIHASTRFQPVSLIFWSKQPNAYSLQDVAVARHVAACVGLAFSHQQLAEAGRQMAEAHARADRLEVRAKSLAAEPRSEVGPRSRGRTFSRVDERAQEGHASGRNRDDRLGAGGIGDRQGGGGAVHLSRVVT
jgi:hypothetical protein